MEAGALEHAAAWCHAQGESIEAFTLIADLWAEDPAWAEAAGWRAVLDRARELEEEKAT